MWTREFESQAYGGYAHRYEGLHLIDADEFIFYRFVNFNEGMYGKTVSELHAGNLRTPGSDSRYAKLFPNHRLSNIGARPQCRQPKVNLRLVTRRMISQRWRKN